VSALVWQPLVIYAYLCVPRVALVLRVPSSELQLNYGFFDQTLAYVGVLLGLYHLVRLIAPVRAQRPLVRLLIVWLHLDFLVRCGEAALMYQFDIGYSSLFFYHLQEESIRLALSQYWAILLGALLAIAAADWVLRRVLAPQPWPPRTAAATVLAVVMLLFGIRCTVVLVRERHRAQEDFAVASLVMNWQTYLDEQSRFERVNVTPAEQNYLRTIGIGLGRLSRAPIVSLPPKQRLNLITIYLEGFQANFTEIGQGPFRGLTPNLDRFASQSLFMSSFYNAVTPTINALISSQCGILAQVENNSLDTDRGYTRNLDCLSDVLHDAGYHQEFLGGADSGFSGKRLFLKAHHMDDVWGWERWGTNPIYKDEARRNAWGLNDTDLMREAIARLPELAAEGPFHLSLLTVNTHEPGFQAPDCPEYEAGRIMLNAIHCTDHAIGELLAALQAGGYLKDTAILIMGDHMMFPSPESVEALGPASAGWFGKVYMAVYWPGGPTPGRIDTPSYTPDFAPIALDVLGFRPLARFAFGRSPIGNPDPRKTLIAAHYQILNGRMIPPDPTLSDDCPPELLMHTTLYPDKQPLSPCGREKVLQSVAEELLAHPARPRADN
jgi:phosphoglycerol transferase MdoB-like AlkP superfamily enzyme